MVKQAKPTLPSELDRGDLTYAFTSSPTTAHLASELTTRDGIRPISYKWADLTQEVQDLITKVWKLEELSPVDLRPPVLRLSPGGARRRGHQSRGPSQGRRNAMVGAAAGAGRGDEG